MVSGIAVAVVLGLGAANAAEGPHFGQPISAADLAPWGIQHQPTALVCRRAVGHRHRVPQSTRITAVEPAMVITGSVELEGRWSAVVRSTRPIARR